MRRLRRPPAVVLLIASLGAALAISTAPAHAATLPACPQVFAHGGYPPMTDPKNPPDPNYASWKVDQVRQPNNAKAIQYYRSVGAVGGESDLRLSRNGHKAVMYHNGTTLALTGNQAGVDTLWWDTGADKLSGRTVDTGVFIGAPLLTFRQFLDEARAQGWTPLVEIKGDKPMTDLLVTANAYKEDAWKEIVDPVKERIATQEIMIFTSNADIDAELLNRFTGDNRKVVRGTSGVDRPVWVDAVPWTESPTTPYTGNVTSWQTALNQVPTPKRMMTSWPKDLKQWLVGKCS